jgi:hypothetical protein
MSARARFEAESSHKCMVAGATHRDSKRESNSVRTEHSHATILATSFRMQVLEITCGIHK